MALRRRLASEVCHAPHLIDAEVGNVLRRHVSFYDGLYAALAAALTVPLLTADGRLAKAPGLRCEVEQVDSQ